MAPRRRTISLAVAAALILWTVPAEALQRVPAAAACTGAPAKPAVRAQWSTAGGPSFTVARGVGKSAPTSIRWTVSYFNPSSLKWSAYSAWKTVVASKSPRVVVRPALSDARSLAILVAIAANACGSSGQQRLEVPLRTAAALVAKPTLAHTLPLRVGSISFDVIAGAATSGLPMSLTTDTSGVCAADAVTRRLTLKSAGECRLRISQKNASISLPNPDLDIVLHIIADVPSLPAVTTDRADDRTGFQIHVVYVTPRGAQAHNYATEGQLALWVELAQAWMRERLGRTFAFDTFGGRLDVTSINSSLSIADMSAQKSSETAGSHELLQALADEYATANGKPTPGKNLLFVVDGELSADYCGFADRPGSLALVTAASPGCWTGDQAFVAQSRGLNWMSATIIHELLHNVGVPHVCIDNSDIMVGDSCDQPDVLDVLTLDASGTQYVGASAAGVDIRTVKVWADGSGSRHIAVDGECYIGEPCAMPRSWWTSGAQVLELQDFVSGSWRTIATFSSRKDSTVTTGFPFTYDTIFTATTAGSHVFRLRLAPAAGWSEYLGEPFTVVVPY